MKRFAYSLSLLLGFTLACAALTPPATETVPSTPIAQTQSTQVQSQNAALVDVYDPARDPSADLQQAIDLAQRENKRIMLEVGGAWCVWCKYIDDFFATHADILQYRDAHYVFMKVNFNEENMNEEFLSQFPEPAGYPHIYVLDSNGKLIHSQNTAELEDGGSSYVPEVFMAFLQKWAEN